MNREPVGREHVFSAIVQQKKLSRKMSWTYNSTKEASDRAVRRAVNSRDAGRPYRFIYRINVYAKYCK